MLAFAWTHKLTLCLDRDARRSCSPSLSCSACRAARTKRGVSHFSLFAVVTSIPGTECRGLGEQVSLFEIPNAH